MGNWLVVVVECGHCGRWKMKRLVWKRVSWEKGVLIVTHCTQTQ